MAYLEQHVAELPAPVRLGLIGSGWMRAFHGESIARRVPGRCEPGTGEINYAAVATALPDAGHEGTVGMEAWASGDDLKAFSFPRTPLETVANQPIFSTEAAV